MPQTPEEDTRIYKVVLNHEEQYSIWPVDRPNPLGWNDAGKSGTKAECLAYIEEVWTDMRPLSLRRQMEKAAQTQPVALEAEPFVPAESLVDILSQGEHPVTTVLFPEVTPKQLERNLNDGYLHLRFTDTRGGTELGLNLPPGSVNLDQADFHAGTGVVHLEGKLTLDFEKVICRAVIHVATLTGTGRLERVPTTIGASIS